MERVKEFIKNGRSAVILRNKQGKPSVHYVDELVASTFIPNDDPQHKTAIRHINGDLLDNRAENLEWYKPNE